MENKTKSAYNKRMTSIARKINWSLWIRKFFGIIFFDAFLLGAVFFIFIIHCNKELPEEAFKSSWQYADNTKVSFVGEGNNLKSYHYKVDIVEGKVYYFPLSELYDYAVPMLIIVGVFQIIELIGSMTNTRRIRKKMRPLNELAIKAEAISKTSYENLENAIHSATLESPKIVTGDRDLQSIEIALNSLLLRMQESRRQQVRFVSDASHELRTPIAVIQGYVNMLDRWGKEDPEVLNESIEALKNESEHMKELVEQLLFLARGDSGRNTLNRSNFDLGDVMREVWEESLMIDENHTYILDGVSDNNEENNAKYTVNGDLAMIKQSIRIFVQNAAKYSPNGSIIKLGVKKNDTGITYIIQDEGIGMSGNDVSHIFERFYRSDDVRSENTGGSGLGLSIAKWIIDAHNGKIEVLSRQEIGTRFTVSFPSL